jgi:hypothetical protein
MIAAVIPVSGLRAWGCGIADSGRVWSDTAKVVVAGVSVDGSREEY